MHPIGLEPYVPRGILNSEAAFMLSYMKALNVNMFVESGRAFGQSTYLIAKYAPHVEVHSTERYRDTAEEKEAIERLAGLGNVHLHYGTAADVLPGVIASEPDRCVAVFLDGPKGAPAIRLMIELSSHPSVAVGFIHDMRRINNGEPADYRAMAEEAMPHPFFSDDEAVVSKLCHLDAEAVRHEVCGDEWFKTWGSYGPTVGAFSFRGLPEVSFSDFADD
jgi:hypothetical protein